MPASNAKIILVVDDDHSIRTGLVEALEYEGYRAHGVDNGKEALLYLAEPAAPGNVGLILLDVMMPVMGGYEFRVEQLKNPLYCMIPVIFISADRNAHLRPESDGVPFFRKPFDLTELYEAIGKNFLAEGMN